MNKLVIVLDVGTTGARAVVFDEFERIVAIEYQELTRQTSSDGRVEQNPLEFIEVSHGLLRAVAKKIPVSDVISVGIATQRETTILWNKKTGEAIYPAIIWQDERTREWCNRYAGHEDFVREKTGLSIIPYFSASKISWLLENVEEARGDEVVFGTPDSWLLYNLTEERVHRTDFTNASRTLLFNIHHQDWDDDVLSLFDIPKTILPVVQPSRSTFGVLCEEILGREIPILAVAGDQQASLFAAGSEVGTTKITYGTGIFVMQIVDENTPVPPNYFLTLTADSPAPQFALEGKVGHAAERISPVLDNPVELEKVMDEIAKDTDPFLRSLPITPSKVVGDGGGSQSDYLIHQQERISDISIDRHKTHNGTALGIARLLL